MEDSCQRLTSHYLVMISSILGVLAKACRECIGENRSAKIIEYSRFYQRLAEEVTYLPRNALRAIMPSLVFPVNDVRLILDVLEDCAKCMGGPRLYLRVGFMRRELLVKGLYRKLVAELYRRCIEDAE